MMEEEMKEKTQIEDILKRVSVLEVEILRQREIAKQITKTRKKTIIVFIVLYIIAFLIAGNEIYTVYGLSALCLFLFVFSFLYMYCMRARFLHERFNYPFDIYHVKEGKTNKIVLSSINEIQDYANEYDREYAKRFLGVYDLPVKKVKPSNEVVKEGENKD